MIIAQLILFLLSGNPCGDLFIIKIPTIKHPIPLIDTTLLPFLDEETCARIKDKENQLDFVQLKLTERRDRSHTFFYNGDVGGEATGFRLYKHLDDTLLMTDVFYGYVAGVDKENPYRFVINEPPVWPGVLSALYSLEFDSSLNLVHSDTILYHQNDLISFQKMSQETISGITDTVYVLHPDFVEDEPLGQQKLVLRKENTVCLLLTVHRKEEMWRLALIDSRQIAFAEGDIFPLSKNAQLMGWVRAR